MNKFNKYKKEDQKDQQTIKLFDKFNRKFLEDIKNKEDEYISLCNFFTTYLDEAKNEYFQKI